MKEEGEKARKWADERTGGAAKEGGGISSGGGKVGGGGGVHSTTDPEAVAGCKC